MKKTKLTFIDIIIIAVLAAAVVFGFLIVRKNIIKQSTEKTVHFSVMATGVNVGSKDFVHIGDEVTISLAQKAYAHVIGVSESPHFESEFNANKREYVSEAVEGKSDLMIDLECTANISETEILNNEAPIRVGEEANVRGKGYAFEGYIVLVENVD